MSDIHDFDAEKLLNKIEQKIKEYKEENGKPPKKINLHTDVYWELNSLDELENTQDVFDRYKQTLYGIPYDYNNKLDYFFRLSH